MRRSLSQTNVASTDA